MSEPRTREQTQIKQKYLQDICPKLREQLDIRNVMDTPCIEKIVINVGVKEATADTKNIQIAERVLQAITGQKPVRTLARNSIAGFKIREGMPIGARVTLRAHRMYVFLEKFIHLALPKVRDFHGVSPRFDGHGNYNLGIKEWNIFPEAEKAGAQEKSHGLNITIHTNTNNDEHAYALLKALGMPFRES